MVYSAGPAGVAEVVLAVGQLPVWLETIPHKEKTPARWLAPALMFFVENASPIPHAASRVTAGQTNHLTRSDGMNVGDVAQLDKSCD